MKAVAVIPARYASERFCGKPLAKDTGKFLIQHVCEKVAQAPSIERVMVATDDERVASAVESFGGECVMTRRDHPSGTDRIAEVARTLDCDIVVNVQGDEPEIEPSAIETLLQVMQDGTDPVATLACSFDALHRDGVEADPNDPNCVKVVVANGRAIYFSRSLVPYPRKRDAGYDGPYLHLGIYAYRRDFLLKLSELKPTVLERTEGLEQLRILENGYTIGVGVVEHACVGIDTPADYAAFVRRYRESSEKTDGAVAAAGRRSES
ncbi:MAG: 3-deoxy-manno-octulosonate cytidylyltransferase [Planctomycetes bacterium]|nr:3-deoxy-manno-octulosonate cytidylyltransferase [Planctomycetota bacterium]